MDDEKQTRLIAAVEDAPEEITNSTVITIPPSGDGLSPTDRLIMMAVQGNADIDKLEKLLDLKAREEDRQAKAAFDKKFAKMQAEFTPVARGKKGYDYTYAPIEDLQAHYGPVISKYGFSYSWREETMATGKRCVMTISGHGHSEETCFDVPHLEGTKQMNAVQIAGAMSTYGRRYTFIAGFGTIISDEDTDADLGFDAGVKYSGYILAIDNEIDLQTLYALVSGYVHDLRTDGDNDGAEIIKKYYTKRKEELS